MGYSDNLSSKIESNNPSIDTRGPLQDMIITPIGLELDKLDSNIQKLKSNFTTDFDNNKTDEELERLGATYGIVKDNGSYATTHLSLKFVKAPVGLVIALGTLCSTSDAKYNFVTLAEFDSSNVQTEDHLSEISGYYEFKIPVRAVETGDSYNIAANRIVNIDVNLPAGTIVINETKVEGGANAESNEDYWKKIQDRSFIIDSLSAGGVEAKVTDQLGSDIQSMHIDTSNHEQVTIYIKTDSLEEVTESKPINNSKFSIKARHIESIDSIIVNGKPINNYRWLGDSIQIMERLPLSDIPPVALVKYNRYSAATQLEELMNKSRKDFFGKKTEVHHGSPCYVQITGVLKQYSKISSETEQAAITKDLLDYINNRGFTTDDLTVQEITEKVFNKYQSTIDFRVMLFQKKGETSHLQGFNLAIKAPMYSFAKAEDINLKFMVG